MTLSLSSFLSSNQYSRENISVPFVAGIVSGSPYTIPTFDNNGTITDPGGLFGWLIYARTTSALGSAGVKGTTADRYILYSNPSDLVQDLNRLSGVTNCLLGNSGSTFAFFIDTGISELSATKNGTDFIHAINFMAYGGNLVIAGSTSGLNSYLSANSTNNFDVLLDPYLNKQNQNWLEEQPYTIGIFPSRYDSGETGLGYTLADFGSVGTGDNIRFFSVYGLKTPTAKLNTDLLKANSTFTYNIPAVSDIGGFFTRAKNLNEIYITIAGLDRSTILNGKVIPTVLWENPLKNTLRSNKVNFFVTYDPPFLGSDLVGVTLSTSALTVNDRVGPARLYTDINKVVNNIGMKYVFQINNSNTRNQITSEIETALDQFATFLDTTKTQIICDSRNNTDNDSNLNIQVIAKPIVSTESFVVTFSYTQ